MTDIQKLYYSNFIYGFGVMAAFTFTLFFLDNGLTSTQIGLLFSVFLFASALLEIPTGSIADTFGHKTSFCLGLIIDAFYYLVFFFSHTFGGFLLGMIVAAIGLSLQSGANTSLVYEILHKQGRAEEYAKIQGRIQTMGLIAVVISAPLATFLYAHNHRLPYLLSFILILVSAVLIYFVKFEFTKQAQTVKQYLAHTKEGVWLTLKHRRFLTIVFLSIIVSTIFSAYLDIVNQPFQLQLGVPVPGVGVVQAIASLASAAAAFYAHSILKRLGNKWAVVLAVLIPGISLVILSLFHAMAGIAFIVIFMASQRYSGPIIGSLQQHESVSKHRSTMSSVANLLATLTGAILLPIWGLLVDKKGLATTALAMGLFIVVMGGVGLYLYFRQAAKTEAISV